MSVQAIAGGKAGSEAVAPPKAAQTKPADKTEPKPQPVAADKVQISSAGQSALQKALQETTETPAQTLQEANNGDPQAKRLLAAREAAAHAAQKPTTPSVAEEAEKASNLQV